MTIGHQLGLRLFLEGVEIPVIGASVTIAPNTPTAASIQVIATDKILKLHPRTLVHLFFYDFVDASSPLAPSVDGMTEEDAFNSQYKLLFVGEVQGLSFQKDTGTRAVVLNCVDLSNYWDTTYQYNFQGSLLGGRSHAAFIGANANFLTSPLGHGVGTISALLSGRSVNFPNLKGLLAGIVHVLEAIGGSYYGDTTFRGANDFTSIAELRLKILQQITAAEADDSTAKLFARKSFNMWMNRQMGSLGKLVTFRGLTQMLQQFIFHDIYPNPAARYVPKVTGLKKKRTYANDVSKDPSTRHIVPVLIKIRKQLSAAHTAVGAYPAATTTGSTQYTRTTARRVGGSETVREIGRNLQAARSASSNLVFSNVPKVFGTDILRMDRHIRSAANALGNDFSVDLAKLSSGSSRATAANNIQAAIAIIDVMLGRKVKRQQTLTYDKLDRLNNQILRPDIWFASPPRCNVLFPEMYGNFSWSRNFLREVSRMELQTTHEILGDDALFNGRYYAPNVVDMRKGVRLSSRQFGRLIMSHELMTGIIPMFEKISEANLFAMKARKVKYKGAKVGYAQRAVNFQYFKHRFASRQMQVSGRFNPWFVCGFPGLLIDRPMDADKLAISGLSIAEQLSALDIVPETGTTYTRADLLRELVGTQYMGCCVQLSHTLSQQGGNTEYAFAQARVHREDTEFLGVDKATVSKKVGTGKRKSIVAAVPSRAPKKGRKGPRGGLVSNVLDVSSSRAGKDLPVFGERRKSLVTVGDVAGPQQTIFIQVHTKQKAQKGQEVYHAYEVTESYVRRRRTKVDLPIEEAIRPPWIWDGWTNLKIGDTYMQFFGTNSLTDIEGFTSRDLLENYIGADSHTALLESKEGLTYGAKKSVESTDAFLERVASTPEEKKPVANKPDGEDVSQIEAANQKLSAITIAIMESERTIEASVDYLVRVYSFIKSHGLDVGSFLRNYTWRPIATLPEILGSTNFSIQEKTKLSLQGESVSDLSLVEKRVEGEYVVSGKEGFHSRAFGDVADLFGLVDPKVRKVLGLSGKNEKQHATAKKLDVRARRRQAVWDYIDELSNSRGLLG